MKTSFPLWPWIHLARLFCATCMVNIAVHFFFSLDTSNVCLDFLICLGSLCAQIPSLLHIFRVFTHVCVGCEKFALVYKGSTHWVKHILLINFSVVSLQRKRIWITHIHTHNCWVLLRELKSFFVSDCCRKTEKITHTSTKTKHETFFCVLFKLKIECIGMIWWIFVALAWVGWFFVCVPDAFCGAPATKTIRGVGKKRVWRCRWAIGQNDILQM